jgi:hypothetical protein
MRKCNLFLTPTGRLNSAGRRLCRLAAEFRSRRKQLADEYRALGYDDFSILSVFREADDRRRLIQQANRRRKRRGRRPAPPGEDPPMHASSGGDRCTAAVTRVGLARRNGYRITFDGDGRVGPA